MTNSVSSATSTQKNVAAFFSGVGGIELGFEETGKFRVVYANEFDKNARITYAKNNPEINLDPRDIHDVEPSNINSPVDIIVGGFPCQAFSIAGYRKGFEDERGDLFFELLRFIKDKNPEAIFIENVKNLVTHDHGITFKVIREALTANNYFIKWKVLNAKDYGNIPQNRERIYVVGFKSLKAFNSFEFPYEIPLTTTLNSLIDFKNQKDDKYYYKDGKQPFYQKLAEAVTDQQTIYQWRRQYVRANKSHVVPTLTANMGTGGHNVPIILSDTGIRKLTPRETFNIQGYPKTFKLPEISNGQLYKQAGNSVVVPVIKRIAENISEALSKDTDNKTNAIVSKKFALIRTKVNGRFAGSSYVERFMDSKDDTDTRNNKDLPIISDDDYLRLIKKGGSLEFYSLTKVE